MAKGGHTHNHTRKTHFPSDPQTLLVSSLIHSFTWPCPRQELPRQPHFAFIRAVRPPPDGVSVSADGLSVSRVAFSAKYQGALLEPAVGSAERSYVEWVIEEADSKCQVMVGVTDLDTAPAGQEMRGMPGSRMYRCRDSKAFPGERDWGAAGARARGDRVGLLVERGSVFVYVNGAQLGPGAMATDLPRRVSGCARFAKLARASWYYIVYNYIIYNTYIIAGACILVLHRYFYLALTSALS
jgi:hypothetical protein